MAIFEKKTVLITGAAGGIGRAVAESFVKQGAHVHLVDLHDEPLQALAGALGAHASYTVADVSNERDSRRYVADALERHGRVDSAFLNAGIVGTVSKLSETRLEVYQRVMDVNVRGVWLGLANIMEVMARQQCGTIVITSSIVGVRGGAGQAAYSASKHAVIGLMKSAALEGAAHGIRINAICPAPIDTDMFTALAVGIDATNPESGKQKVLSGIPLRRLGTADEVAKLVSFLASDDSSYRRLSTYLSRHFKQTALVLPAASAPD